MSSRPNPFKRLKKLVREIPEEKEILATLQSLRNADDPNADRAAAIVGATFLESALETAILSKLVPLSEESERPGLFDGEMNGPLSDLAARIKMAYALGLFGDETLDELRRVRHIRNAFAHGAVTLHFEHPDIWEICNGFHLYERSATAEGLFGASPKDRFISTVVFIASRLRRNIDQSLTPGQAIRRMGEILHKQGELS